MAKATRVHSTPRKTASKKRSEKPLRAKASPGDSLRQSQHHRGHIAERVSASSLCNPGFRTKSLD
jgi:hypothetical protein